MTVPQISPFEEVCSGLAYPEAPVWMPDGSLLVVEVAAGQLTRLRPPAYQPEVLAKLGGGPNGAAFGPDGRLYICNDGGLSIITLPMHGYTLRVPSIEKEHDYEGGSMQAVDLKTGAVERLWWNQGKSLDGLRGPDDIVFDQAGGYWMTDWGKEWAFQRDYGAIYYAPSVSDMPRIADAAAFGHRNAPNGIALSPDGGTLYVAETYARWTRSWRIGPGGTLQKNLATFDGSYLHCGSYPKEGRLDSMKMDEQGNLYVVTILPDGLNPLSNGGISVVSPSGQLLAYWELNIGAPDPLPSNLCFGGSDRKTLFVTLGGTGRVIRCQVSIPGLPLAFQSY